MHEVPTRTATDKHRQSRCKPTRQFGGLTPGGYDCGACRPPPPREDPVGWRGDPDACGVDRRNCGL